MRAVSEKDLPTLLWLSIPCTGGTPWKHYNMKRGKSTRKLIAKRIRDFRMIWASAEKVMEKATQNSCVICLEWPKNCDYWKRKEVLRTIEKLGLESTTFHGCMYGLVSQMRSTKGYPINKPWRLATNRRRMMRNLDRVCTNPACCDLSLIHI